MDNEIVKVFPSQEARVGLYIRAETRDRLNVYKARRSLATGRVYSQSDAIDELLVLVGEVQQHATSGG